MAMGRRLHPILPEDEYDNQPLADESGRFLFTADARLDNRAELAARLRVADPRQLADSELLFRTVVQLGIDSLEHVLGEFAFALFDRAKDQLLLARDPLGQRPLFWHRAGTFVAFASMPQGLHSLEEVKRAPDLNSVTRFACLIPQERCASFYEGVQRVEPGHWLKIGPAQENAHRYWVPTRKAPPSHDFDDCVLEYRDRLDKAVRARLRRSSGKIACHLSGGWDSNAVTATAARELAKEREGLLAFTAVPKVGAKHDAPLGRIPDEGPLSRFTPSRYANITHHLLQDSGRSPIRDFDQQVAHLARPAHNPCNQIWLNDIRRAAKENGASVMLVGDLGNWTISTSHNALLADYVGALRIGAWWRAARPMLSDGRARLRGVAAASVGPWLPSPLWKALGKLSVAHDAKRISVVNRELFGTISAEDWELSHDGPYRARDHFERASTVFLDTDVGEHRKAVLAAWGVEERDPTADLRLVEMSLSLPVDLMLSGPRRRPLAHAALQDRVPQQVLTEEKRGYQAAGWLEALINDPESLETLLDKISSHDLAAHVLDVPKLRYLVSTLPKNSGSSMVAVGQYRIALLYALSAGHFLVSFG